MRTCNARDMTVDEKKGLFTVRFSSSYGARYATACFPAEMAKVFTFNIDPDNPHLASGKGMAATLPWLRHVCRGDAASMALESVDDQAIARRITVFHLTRSVLNDEDMNAFQEKDEAKMGIKRARYAAWKLQHGKQ